MSKRPPDNDLMRSATRSADMPGPGKRFGQEVTMRQRLVWARAIDGAATAPRTPVAPLRTNLLRVICVIARSLNPRRTIVLTTGDENDAPDRDPIRSTGGPRRRSPR